ncbi:MAG TPA: PTS sugar transporter subunit IIA [Thermoanaerobaculales bacterium]|nr:PTS sugar transporter subunit IIA [Thermoanaerobaculales bacterium]HQL28599.1 PTS sugar transporter subunit IIA [Thermoanaerobaculales bacterium]
MRLSGQLASGLVLIDPDVADRDGLLHLFGSVFQAAGLIADGEEVARRLLARERVMSTGIGGGIAVPHAQVPGLGRLAMAASTHPSGIPYPAVDEQSVRLTFCLVGDSTTAADHLAGLARLARLACRSDFLEGLVGAETASDFLERLGRLEGE